MIEIRAATPAPPAMLFETNPLPWLLVEVEEEVVEVVGGAEVVVGCPEDVGGVEDAVLGDPDEEDEVVGVLPVAAAWYSARAVALALTAKT